jgi:hypothetical protein
VDEHALEPAVVVEPGFVTKLIARISRMSEELNESVLMRSKIACAVFGTSSITIGLTITSSTSRDAQL